MKFGKFELNLALTGFVKFIVAARKFVSVKQASADFTAVRVKKARIWLLAYKFNGRVKFDTLGKFSRDRLPRRASNLTRDRPIRSS